MTLQAIADRRRMHRTFDVGRILVGVAGETEGIGRGRYQLNVGCIPGVADLVAGCAAHGHRRMHRFSLSLVFMTGNASRSVRLRVKWDGMLGSMDATSQDEHYDETN